MTSEAALHSKAGTALRAVLSGGGFHPPSPEENNFLGMAVGNRRHELFIECSTPQGSIGVATNDDWHEEKFESDRSHNCALFAPLENVLKEHRRPACEHHSNTGETPVFLSVIVGTGPGSYSGTRVGIAAGQGVAIVHDCPAVGLPSILSVPMVVSGKKCIAIGDARRGDWWYAIMNHGKMIVEPTLTKMPELLEILAQENAEIFSLEKSDAWNFSFIIHEQTPSAAGLQHAWSLLSEEEKTQLTTLPLQPVYLKPPHITVA